MEMDATALRELQAPLKAAYRERPEAALVTLKAAGDLAEGAIACKVETGRALVEAGLHPATGGSGLEAWSRGMLLGAHQQPSTCPFSSGQPFEECRIQ